MTDVIAGEERHRLTATTGIAALGLDALASCAYGPEAIVAALAAAGAAGIAFTLPVTAVIVALLGVLVLSYRQVIAAYPDGGGAYTVSRDNLGLRPAMVAAASLVVDCAAHPRGGARPLVGTGSVQPPRRGRRPLRRPIHRCADLQAAVVIASICI
jgi:amino acid transporter